MPWRMKWVRLDRAYLKNNNTEDEAEYEDEISER